MTLATRLKAVAAIDQEHWVLEYDGRRASWDDVAGAAQAIDDLTHEAGGHRDAPVVMIVRNSLASALAVLATLQADRAAVYVNALQRAEKRVDELRSLRPAVLLGEPEDFSPDVLGVLHEIGGIGLCIGDDLRVSRRPETTQLGAGPFLEPFEGAALVMQTSGTTGAPKRITLSAKIVLEGLREGSRKGEEQGGLPDRIPRSPTFLFAPLFHASGTFGLLMSVYEARPVVIFDKFKVDVFRSALSRYPVRFLSMPPAVIRMVLDSDLTREELGGLLAVRSGTAPLDPQVQEEFENRFGVPVLTTYGATEFMGALARWTLADHAQFARAKRGSVGRVSPGVDLRIVDADTGQPTAPDEPGLLEVRGKRVGSEDWVRTNDIARLDAEGFLYILGRADDAIVRGGFKVLAGQVAEVLSRHEKVFEAAVIGIPDARLGEVPVAVVELCEGVEPPSQEDLFEFARQHLVAYQVPARILIVPKLPRTVSMKVSRPDLRALFEPAAV